MEGALRANQFLTTLNLKQNPAGESASLMCVSDGIGLCWLLR